MGEREKAFKMLVHLADANGSLVPDDFAFVLDYCAKTPDPMVRSIWMCFLFPIFGFILQLFQIYRNSNAMVF